MPISVKRIYEMPAKSDGYRVLVDRLWPRGVSKEEANLDEWLKEVAPSDELRKWFHSDPSRWGEFRLRYLAELKEHRATLRDLAMRSQTEPITLLYSSSNPEHNNAIVLQQYLKMLGGC